MKIWQSAMLTSLTLLALTQPARADDTAGAITTETRHMQGFKDLEVDTDAKVVFTVAPTTSVTIAAPANLLPLLLTRIDGDTLVIKRKSGNMAWMTRMFDANDIKIAITGPALRSISITGSGSVQAPTLSGDAITLEIRGSGSITAAGASAKALTLTLPGSGEIHVAGINTQSTTVALQGSGEIEVAGTTQQFDSSIAGSGEIHAGDLKTDGLKADLSGSGEMSAYALKSATVSVTGSGSVTVAGNPAQRNIDTSGSGSIKFK